MFLILRRNGLDVIKKYMGLHVKCLLFLSDMNKTWISYTNFRKKKTQISNLIKIRLAGAELFRADGREDRHDEANSRFSKCCERT